MEVVEDVKVERPVLVVLWLTFRTFVVVFVVVVVMWQHGISKSFVVVVSIFYYFLISEPNALVAIYIRIFSLQTLSQNLKAVLKR